jgi:uncharacterized protein (TIGR00730 family)
MIGTVAVFCGSRLGNDPAYARAAAELGAGLAAAGTRLIYGGGAHGLMGVLADAALAGGGSVTGIIPGFLSRFGHAALGQLDLVGSMHERKARLFAEADAFVALPGGIGTLDELIEVITWRSLDQHDKPILVCDVAGSSAPAVAAIEAAIGNGFSPASLRGLFEVRHGAAATLARLRALP